MAYPELFFIAFGLAMDAFAVAICKGLAIKTMRWKQALTIAAYFGIFQGLMPILGYTLGYWFQDEIEAFDHWVAFLLLSFIGLRMIWESRKPEEQISESVDFRNMVVLAIATSIDALAVGITFAFLQVNIVPAATIIATVTFCIALIGVAAGHVFGCRFRSWAELAGGLLLVLIGLKILLDHLTFLHF